MQIGCMNGGNEMRPTMLSRAQFRRWVVTVVEYCIYMFLLTMACVLTAMIMGACLKALGVA